MVLQGGSSIIFLATLTAQLALLLQCPSSTNASFIMKLESGQEECFSLRVPGKTPSYITGDFEWLDDDLSPDPTFVILQDEDMEPVYESPDGASEGTFTYLGTGTYHLCLSNGAIGGDDIAPDSDGETRHVGFNFRVRPQPPEMGGGDQQGADDEKTARILKVTGELMDGIQFLEDHHSNWRAREAAHKKVSLAIHKRVLMWTLAEAFVLIVISCGQVIYLRKFFERKRYL